MINKIKFSLPIPVEEFGVSDYVELIEYRHCNVAAFLTQKSGKKFRFSPQVFAASEEAESRCHLLHPVRQALHRQQVYAADSQVAGFTWA